MATTKKTAPKKAQKSAQPDIITGATLEVEAPVPENSGTAPVEPPKPEWQKVLEEDYGHIIRNRDQTALLTAILTELVKIRVR